MFDVIASWLHHWHMRIVTHHKLSSLDDRLLADIGIERSHINDLARICSQIAAKDSNDSISAACVPSSKGRAVAARQTKCA